MNKNQTTIFFVLALVLSISACGCMGQTHEQQNTTQGTQQPQATGTVMITDMHGRNVSVPVNISSVITTWPPSTVLVYMLTPEKLAGWNFVNKFEHTFMDDRYLNLPVIGGWLATQKANYETLSSANPSIVISQGKADVIQRDQEMFGIIPVVAVNDSLLFLTKGDSVVEFTGELLGVPERANKLITLRKSVLSDINSTVSKIPAEERVRVYYAEGPEGLTTDPSGSMHSQLFEICGGINVADCPLTPGIGMTQVNMEQVIRWKPDLIITDNQRFYSSVYSDPLWANLDAVKNKRVYLAPVNPICWIDRPVGPHMILGAAWTARCFYPEHFTDKDLRQLTKDFYSEFFHYDLTDEDMDQLLNPQTETTIYSWGGK